MGLFGLLGRTNGYCGESGNSTRLYRSYDKFSKTLTITGRGTMKNFSAQPAPWSYHAEKIATVIIKYGVKNIGNCAFDGCRNLKNVTIPESVTEIGSGAFGFCSNLKSVTLPKSLRKIGESAFERCDSLTNVTISSIVTYNPELLMLVSWIKFTSGERQQVY